MPAEGVLRDGTRLVERCAFGTTRPHLISLGVLIQYGGLATEVRKCLHIVLAGSRTLHHLAPTLF